MSMTFKFWWLILRNSIKLGKEEKLVDSFARVINMMGNSNKYFEAIYLIVIWFNGVDS